MADRFEVHPCPICGGRVTIATQSDTLSGWLRVAPFAGLNSARVVWQEHQGEEYALIADLIALGVCAADSVLFLTLDRDDGSIVPLGLAVGARINRQPLLDALRPQLHPRCCSLPAVAAEGRPLGRG